MFLHDIHVYYIIFRYHICVNVHGETGRQCNGSENDTPRSADSLQSLVHGLATMDFVKSALVRHHRSGVGVTNSFSIGNSRQISMPQKINAELENQLEILYTSADLHSAVTELR